ncbi:MAG: rod shape-determining protein MreC [Lachnospiraceae bacterium]|nr:rod shape-determining protein MreC [Lachnospiraceae bacterium]
MRRRRNRNFIPSRILLAVMILICIILLFTSYVSNFTSGPIHTIANYLFVPMQKGIDYIGNTVFLNSEESKTKEALLAENEELKSKVNDLTNQINTMQLQQNELEELQSIYQLDHSYGNYEKTGARVIAKSTSNWFNTFTINKGSADGIEKDMNVLAGSGLVGIVTDVGTHYAVVRSIIDDTSSVSGMVISTGDNCIVSGSLKDMTNDNMILFGNLEDTQGAVNPGDSVVTSNISDKYLPGLLIGYVTQITDDDNHLTKSGKISPVADFKHLQDVLVITTKKEVGDVGSEASD